MKQQLLILFFLLSFPVWSALPDFTLTVTATNETCPGNGSLSFSVSGTDPSATITYSVYHLPNITTPIATLSGNTYGGLVSGNYRVIATQTLGAESNTQQQDKIIDSAITVVAFSLDGQNAVCGNDGKITVLVTNGTAVSYEIFSGPVTRPLQPSPVFDLLPPGSYQIRVFDACGEGVVQNFTLQGSVPGFTIAEGTIFGAELPTCDSVKMMNELTALNNHIISYPLDITVTVHPPSGPAIIFTQHIPVGNPGTMSVTQTIPLYYGQNYTYDIVITDSCGNNYTRNGNIVDVETQVSLTPVPVSCENKKLVITPGNFVPPFTVSFVSAPVGFNPAVYNSGHPGPFSEPVTYYNPSVILPEGNYTVQITDSCNHSATKSLTIVHENSPAIVTPYTQMGCDPGFGAIGLTSAGATLISVKIMAAPAAYGATLPQDVSFNISTLSPSNFAISGLPSGFYTFQTLDSCNTTQNVTVLLLAYFIASNNNQVIPGCNSFDLDLRHISNLLQVPTYWLQKLDPVTNQWGHPGTGNSIGDLSPGTAVQLINNFVNPNLAYTGTFRVLKYFKVIASGSEMPIDCISEIYNFEYNPQVKIDNIYAFSCSPASSDVIVNATGTAPLIYRITTKNGQPFEVENDNDFLFTGLEPAIYTFQVEDSCGNILNRVYDISTPVNLVISPSGLCDGQPGSLSVPALPFLQFQWWKGSNQTTILSTTNSLSFASFNSVTDAGIYHVRITYPNTNSCVDLVLDFTISAGLSNPQAGNNGTANYCGTPGTIDLFTILSGTYDSFGQWQELTSSGSSLLGSQWDSSEVQPGNYTFKYTVNGLCNAVDESTVDISILPLTETPVAFIDSPICAGSPLELYASQIIGASYSWTGPDNFTSSEQNPVIANATSANSGIYTVIATANGCPSGQATVEVNVLPQMQFTIEAVCIGSAFTLTAIPSNASQENITYNWTGPENFSASGNPVIITGNPAGTYLATATVADGCDFTASVEVPSAVCDIPKGVSPNNDGDNDTWNLSGMDIDHVKIFNRYGMMIYEKARYVNEWNGQDKNGNELPSATYYYVVRMNSGESKTGWVYLIRNQ